MKKFTKVCLVLAAVFAILGVAGCAVGILMGAGRETIRNAWENSELELGEMEFRHNEIGGAGTYPADEVRSLDISLRYGILEIEENENSEVAVKAEKKDEEFHMALENGVLTIRDAHGESRLSHHHRSSRNRIILRLPKGMELEQVAIDNDAGEVYADTIKADKIKLNVGAGNAEMENLDAEEIDMECGVGSIAVELPGREADYNYHMSCGIGNININRKSYTALGGEQKVKNSADRNVRLKCGVGNITLETSEEK